MDIERLRQEERDELVRFCVDLVKTPSPPGEEGRCAEAVRAEMARLGYDEVWSDRAGNIIGLVRGRDPDSPKVMLNSHMDHVHVGDLNEWRYPPFGGEIHDGKIYGRGASDNKGAIAVQVHSLGYLLRRGLRPKGDVYVTAVVLEETGGTGTAYILESGEIKPDVVILGEGTSNRIYLGHRGGVVVEVTFIGKSAHASAPDRGINPLYPAARFLLALQRRIEDLPVHPDLGRSTISPTLCRTPGNSTNVIPSSLTLILDWRTTKEDRDFVIEFVHDLAREAGAEVEVRIPIRHNRTYTGYEDRVREAFINGFVTPPDNPFVLGMRRAIVSVLGEEPEIGYWRFATDGRLSAGMGITTFGFSPCDEEAAHCADEFVRIGFMEEAVICYANFLKDLPLSCPSPA
jgi:putative selenium metabolism hydrolase